MNFVVDDHNIMKLVNSLLCFVVCVLLISHCAAEKIDWNLSIEEEIELEEQLKLINKRAVKSIHAQDGWIYDCIDFYKQPAFDHPSLKTKRFYDELEYPDPMFHIGSLLPQNDTTNSKVKDDECPIGTVLIRRMTKSDLLSSKYVGENLRARYAVLRTKAGPKRYSGAGGSLTIYKPDVTLTQYSASRLVLKNGNDSIEVGWRVDPGTFGDHRCRFYLRSLINNKLCFGARCPGFFIADAKADVEADLSKVVSTRGGAVYIYRFDISRDIHGNWWVTAGPNETKIGYWPRSIFSNNGLQQLASYAEWGGEVGSPLGTPKPPMGSGFFPVGNATLDCFYYKMTLKTETGQVIDANDVEPFANNAGYEVIDLGNTNPKMGHAVLFGGPNGGM